MFATIARLFAVRPFFATAIFGFPVLLLVAVGLFTIWALKLLVFVVLPIALVLMVLRWIVRKANGHRGA